MEMDSSETLELRGKQPGRSHYGEATGTVALQGATGTVEL